MKPVNQSLESLNSEVVYFLLCVVFWMLKSISFTRPISRVFLIFDLQQCKMIYSFVDISQHLSSFESGHYVSSYLDRCLNTVPWSMMVNKTLLYIVNNVP